MRGCPAHFYLFKTVGSDPNLKGGTCFAIKSKKKCLTKLFNAIHFSKPNMFESLKLFSSLTPKTYFTLGLLGLYGIYKTLTKHYKKSALFLLCFIFQNVNKFTFDFDPSHPLSSNCKKSSLMVFAFCTGNMFSKYCEVCGVCEKVNCNPFPV